MSTRNEIKVQLRENTKEAFRLIGEKARPGVGYTTTALANMTEGRLSAKSIEMFFRKNRNSFKGAIRDTASIHPSAGYFDICVQRTSKSTMVHKTYINAEDPYDTIEFDKCVELYYINKVSIA